MELLHSNITDKILKAFYGFKNVLPVEFALPFFQNGLEIELKDLNLQVEKNKAIDIFHKRQSIGKINADFVVNELIIVKLVSSSLEIEEKEVTAMKSLLRLTNYEVGLILNFGPDGQHKRVYLTNNFKKQSLSENSTYKLNPNEN
jgi:GxxExxY protein